MLPFEEIDRSGRREGGRVAHSHDSTLRTAPCRTPGANVSSRAPARPSPSSTSRRSRRAPAAGDALRNSLDLARHAERLGYRRYWVAEHHNMPGIASAATAVVIGHIAAGTSTIRVGAGGIMLPNHSPLVIAEQFGTLESLYPGRIDLGLGPAPGTDQLTARALRRNLSGELRVPAGRAGAAGSARPRRSRARGSTRFPGRGSNVPLWILGSSTFGARLAAAARASPTPSPPTSRRPT